MSDPSRSEASRRDRRAGAIAELLRAGHDPRKVSEAARIADAGGNIYEAMAALYGTVGADGKPATLKVRMADGSTFRVEGTIKDVKRATKPWKVVDLGPGLTPMRTYWLNPDQIVYIEEIPGA